MPTYEYECPGCQEAYDVLHRISDPPLTACVKCGGSGVRKKLAVPTILLRRQGPQSTASESPTRVPGHLVAGNFGKQGVTIDAVPPDFSHPALGLFALGVPDTGG